MINKGISVQSLFMVVYICVNTTDIEYRNSPAPYMFVMNRLV